MSHSMARSSNHGKLVRAIKRNSAPGDKNLDSGGSLRVMACRCRGHVIVGKSLTASTLRLECGDCIYFTGCVGTCEIILALSRVPTEQFVNACYTFSVDY